jgi:hypothetical protein
LLEELAEESAKRIGRMHREYLWARPPRRKRKEGEANEESGGRDNRMRMLTLGLWQKWLKVLLRLRRRSRVWTASTMLRGESSARARYVKDDARP